MESVIQEPEELARNWLELPLDVTRTILLKLGAFEILQTAQRVCRLWRRISQEPLMWRSITLSNVTRRCDIQNICRLAIDRSSGLLVDISIESFGTDDLLDYISDRAINLRRLRLLSCTWMSDEALIRIAAKHRKLQDVEFSYCPFTKEALTSVGRSCPLLTSLKWNNKWWSCGPANKAAFAIARCMPELRHLQLVGHRMNNDGLQEILDGCPHLESLDIRQCYNISLEGSFKVRCAKIKYLRPPNDNTDDYEYKDIMEYDSDEDDFGDDFSFDDDFSFYEDLFNDPPYDEEMFEADLFDGNLFDDDPFDRLEDWGGSNMSADEGFHTD